MEQFDQLLGSPLGAILIFALAAVNVTIMTMRTIMSVRGRRIPAAVLGFFQMLVWLLAVGGALKHLDSAFHVLGYAGGYATGNYIGVWLEQRLALGTSIVRAVSPSKPHAEREGGSVIADTLRDHDFAVTEMPARGWRGDVDVLNVVVPRKKVPEVVRMVEERDPNVVISVDNIEAARGGFPMGPKEPSLPMRWRKAA